MTRAELKTQRLLNRLKKYAVAATAVGASTGALSEKSEADVIVFNGPVSNIGFTGVAFDATSGATTSSSSATGPYDFSIFGTGGQIGIFDFSAGASVTGILPSGATIDAGSSFSTPFSLNPMGTGNVFFGFRVSGEPSLPDPIYGWAEVSVSVHTATLHRWAYENTGGAIMAGDTGAAVPEPSSLAACATLAMAGGLASIRRRRKQKAAEKDDSAT